MTDSELMQLSERVGLALKARGATVTTAESCTGGWVAKAITDIAGRLRYLNKRHCRAGRWQRQQACRHRVVWVCQR